MKNTFLFDLDGTLLPMDFDQFMTHYFANMAKHFEGMIDGKTLMKYVLEATEVMVKATDGRSNRDVFMEHFATLIDDDIDTYEEHFGLYYDTLFENVRVATKQSEEMLHSVALLKAKGYTVAIATNPLFPYRANIHRLRWAGFKLDDFEHMTSFEGNSYCKPHVEYYQEVLDAIGKKPEECVMVGNDVFDDLPAQKLGIETYLITDCLINKYDLPNTAEHTGNYHDFYQYVKDLPPVREND